MAFIAIAEDLLCEKSEMFISSQDLLSECTTCEELSRLESPKALANFLRNFDLRPGKDTTGKCRGYELTRDWVNEWKQRYRDREEEQS